MSGNNPYATPKADITTLNTGEIEYNESKWYSFSGRIGRLRYLAYPMIFYLVSLLAAILIGVIVGFLSATMGGNAELMGNIVGVIVMIPMMIFCAIIYPIRRLHDLGKSGWLVLITFIPLVNILFYLYLLFGKGDPDENEYGEPPRPNQWYHWVLGLAMPIVVAIGILVAIALPAYQDYANRSQTTQNAQPFQQGQ